MATRSRIRFDLSAVMQPEAAVRVSIRLIRKLAECLDDVDLSKHRVGDVFEVSLPEARLLLAERWAVLEV
jgi:hypothetical protein